MFKKTAMSRKVSTKLLELLEGLQKDVESGLAVPHSPICSSLINRGGSTEMLGKLHQIHYVWLEANPLPQATYLYPVGGPLEHRTSIANCSVWQNKRRLALLKFDIDTLRGSDD